MPSIDMRNSHKIKVVSVTFIFPNHFNLDTYFSIIRTNEGAPIKNVIYTFFKPLGGKYYIYDLCNV